MLLMTSVLVFASDNGPSKEALENSEATKSQIFMPLIVNITPFNPNIDTELEGGTYTFSSVNIPADVTVSVMGDVTINVLGDTQVTGKVIADCYQIEINGQEALTISGEFDNRCVTNQDDPGDLILYTQGGDFQIGTANVPAKLNTSGNLDVGNAPDLQDWEFDVLPDQRATQDLPPVCSAWADSLYESVITSTVPISITFFGNGVDPDGGPVSYAWDFGDGNISSGQDVLHAYDTWGIYDVTLTVTDDDGQICEATLQIVADDGEMNLPDQPGLWASPLDLIVEAGQEGLFESSAVDPQGDKLTYQWNFGNGITATVSHPTQTFGIAGRYPVTLTVNDAAMNTATATASIYVYEESSNQASNASPLDVTAPTDSCAMPTFNAVVNKGQADPGRNGKSARFRGRGDVFLGAGTDIQAMDGGDGANRTGSGVVIGRRGGRGGSLSIYVSGSLTICSGASLAAGSGGDGGEATSNTPAAGMALARGGNGGPAAHRLRIAATQSINFNAATVTIDPGSGGDGGDAYATGGDGQDQCTTGQRGASARAIGGNGGRASKIAVVRGAVTGLGNVTVTGGQGGLGGDADAQGGDGGQADCMDSAVGGLGRPGYARGGRGGDARLSGAGGFGLAASAFTAGDGGDALAWGGDGGNASALASGACNSDATATGGNAGDATAYGGKGGRGRFDGNGGNADAYAGWGGDADALGGDCDQCGEAGGNAVAIGGDGADAYARYGRKGGSGGADGIATTFGGDGGDTYAEGGDGGSCPTCPGDGGPGGAAEATGGDAGDGQGNGNNTGGDGGDADPYGGAGGDGADCACEKFLQRPGGNGGDGGPATADVGNAGSPDGNDGLATGMGGSGGDGGEGNPPGTGGAGGAGSNVPDGNPGADGAVSPCPEITIWFIYHSTIPDGIVPPGTDFDLGAYTQTITSTLAGTIPTHFLTDAEYQNWTGSTTPVQYTKTMDGNVYLTPGGISYDLPEPSIFPTIGITASVVHNCQVADCVQIIGLYQGEAVSVIGNQDFGGTGQYEDLWLPPPPAGVPHYDSFILIGTEDFFFFHWWIIIVDP